MEFCSGEQSGIVREGFSLIEAANLSPAQQQDSEQQLSTPLKVSTVPLENAVNGDESGPAAAESEDSMRDSYQTERTSCTEEETPVHEQEAFLYAILNELQGLFPSLVFTLSQVHDSPKSVPVLQISQRQLFNHVLFGAVSRVQAAVYYKSYIGHVLMRQWKSSRFENMAEIRDLCHIMEEKSEYKFCPGVERDHYNKEYHDVIRFHI